MAERREPREAPDAAGAADELRREAEERIDKLSAAAAAAAAAASPVSDDLAEVVHELRVHQIELEMQNEELRRAQLELDEQREKYFELFDAAPVGYLTLSDRGIVGDANLTAAHLLGVDRQLLVGQSLSAFVSAPDRDAYYLHQRVLHKSGEPQTFELRLQRAGGAAGDDEAGGDAPADHFWARLEAQPRRAGDGESLMWWVTFADITEHTLTLQALRASEAMRNAAENVAHVGSWSWTPGAQKVTWSPEMFRLFDVDADGFDGDIVPVLDARVHPDDREELTRTTAEANATGVAVPVEFRVVHRDGSEHVLMGGGTSQRDEASGAITFFGYYQDVTERRRAENTIRRFNEELEERIASRTGQLEAANKELEAFVYSASHDLRAPLRAIDGFSQMVVEDAGDKLSDEDLEHLQRVRAGAERMAALIDQLLGLSRASRQEMLIEDVDLSAVARAVLEELREAHPDRAVETVVAPRLRAQADAVLLRAILANLLSNAWKFTSSHETARVEVGVCDVAGERAFFVRDDGVGFDSAYAAHLFGAFQRMHAEGQFEGDGIGLATVQRLVTRHGGRVWAEADVEQGATFFFTLPAARPSG